jgi:DNA-binding CsgD family transcriptional regulator
MNNHPLLVENENKRLTLRLPMLICFAMFTAWQMGITLFSGETLSVAGRTPIPFEVNSDVITALIVAGYIISILFLIIFQRRSVMAARTTLVAAFLSLLASYIPFAPQTLAFLFYVQVFCCVFLIGVMQAVIINLFTEKTEIKDLIVTLISAGGFIAFLHNDIVPVSFGVFQGFTVIALVLLLLFFYKLPSKVWPCYLKKSDGMVKPRLFMTALYALIGFSSVITLFGSAVAEGTAHGVFAYYVSLAVCGVILAVLWKGFGIIPLKSASAMLGAGAFGFVAVIAAIYLPAFALPACVLLGAGGAVCWMTSYFGIVMAKRYPSRFIAPSIMAIAFAAVLLQTVLLEALRDNLTSLYIVYLVISVGMVILYLLFEPYLGHSFRGRTFQDIIGVVAEDADGEETLAPESVPLLEDVNMEPAAPETEAERTDTAAPDDGSPHSRRMQILMTHAIEPLTRREYQLAECIMRSMTRSEIAEALVIKPESVGKYRNRIYSKFGIHKRQELFSLAETLDREIPEG